MEPAPSSPCLYSHRSGTGGKGWASTRDMSTHATAAGELHASENTHAHEQQLLGSYTHTHTHTISLQQLLKSYTQHATASQEHTQAPAAGESHRHTRRGYSFSESSHYMKIQQLLGTAQVQARAPKELHTRMYACNSYTPTDTGMCNSCGKLHLDTCPCSIC